MEQALIEAVESGDFKAVEDLVSSGVNVNQVDERGWAPLNFAARKGDLYMVKLLVEGGADLYNVGQDKRTPNMIALAAGHSEVARYLLEVESRTNLQKARLYRPEIRYCRAYHLKELRKFKNWSESRINWVDKGREKKLSGNGEFAGDKIVFIHHDFTVTETTLRNENVIFNRVGEPWRQFCLTALGFRPPDELNLIAATPADNQS